MSFIRKHLVTILVAFSLVAFYWFFLRDNQHETPMGAAPPSQEQSLLEASLQNAKGQQEVGVAEKPLPTPQTAPKARVTDVVHKQHGAVVRSLGKPIVRDGVTYRLLCGAKDGCTMEVMYPVNRPLKEIRANMSFDGIRPPPGELAVFDTFEHPEYGTMNVFAWKLH
ncbi:MAG: hypothetical protein RLZZ517_217 [Candidatus Parcubacteria bacterium]|jgi:hypothetical protein